MGGEAAALELELPLAAALRSARPFAAHFYAPEGLVLLQEELAPGGYFAGSLPALSLAEVFGHVLSGIRSGVLVVRRGALRKSVHFRDAQVVFATSTEAHERLGSVLTRLGLVSTEQLAEGLRAVAPGVRLGQALTRAGYLTEANLYNAMTYLVREVVVDLFELPDGDFLFLEGAPPPEGDSLKLPERTRELVLEGMKRAEGVLRLRERFPDSARVQPLPDAMGAPGEERLLTRAAARPTVGELRTHFEGSLYGYLHWLDERVRDGTFEVALLPEPGPPELAGEGLGAAALGPEARYAALIARVAEAMRRAGLGLESLRGFLLTPPPTLQAAFEGVTLSEEGLLDVERLKQNVAARAPVLARARTLEALDAFAAYALFSARNLLSEQEAAALARAYRALQEGSP
nr:MULTISPECIES: DUF4388 domain-containing protein [Myxococcaceae]